MRSPLCPGVSVPTNVPIISAFNESVSLYFRPTMSIIFFHRIPFSNIVIGIARYERSMYSILVFCIMFIMLLMSVWDMIAMNRNIPIKDMYFVDISMCDYLVFCFCF